ncbi:glycosyl transferase [Alteribacter lacisalsi]|uniref:Glycosyl transferase n=1 Tax=Alteribacter lacisalsi TaxID=2045244 RepID=A0A2W0HKG0_9BACI|nr:glycosyltransferase family 2 protein [Alteribacter lacisalsi]PYZ97572.1 glycosyl transferase [Alteribacter lacisalsi]
MKRGSKKQQGKQKQSLPIQKQKKKKSGSRKSGSPLLSVIIPAMNEAQTIRSVIRGAKKITPRTEVIVVCNGSRDQTAAIAQKNGAKVIKRTAPLGHDVGRVIGARHAQGKVLLFLDADYNVPVKKLRRFYRAVLNGADVALNRYSGYRSKTTIHSTSQAKRLLNTMVGNRQLVGSSMTTTPHAISRRALTVLGAATLAVPPAALAKALLNGLVVKRTVMVNVRKRNKKRSRSQLEKITRLINGDHIEAFSVLTSARGSRGGFNSGGRRLDILADVRAHIAREHKGRAPNPASPLSVVISACNEAKTIRKVVQEVRALVPKEIVVIENGSSDGTYEAAVSEDATVVSFPFALGHDTGRAVGALLSSGDQVLFLDADFVIPSSTLSRFLQKAGTADVCLNHITPLINRSSRIDHISMAKKLLNYGLGRDDLGYDSLTAIPHLLTRKAIMAIGPHTLAVPPKALASAIYQGLSVTSPGTVDVISPNPRRAGYKKNNNTMEAVILGDHLEAFGFLQPLLGVRLRLPDTIRRRNKL